MGLTRREFVGTGITVLGFTLVKFPGLDLLWAQETDPVAEVPLIWIATGSCTGCSVSLLNSASPNIQETLLGEILPGKHLSLGFHTTVMASAGEPAMAAMHDVIDTYRGQYVLLVDGATAMGADGFYCSIGETPSGEPITGYDHVRDVGREAAAVLAIGACSSYGGIPAAPPNPTDCVSVGEIFRREGIETPVVNIPGCPPHPDWIVGTVATILLGGLKALDLDEDGRPKAFFGSLIHDNCPYRGQYDRGEFAEHFGEHGCLLKLGCKGPITNSDCPLRKWNDATSWCIEAGHPCIGCVEPEFPYELSMFEVVEPSQLSPPAAYPPATAEGEAAPISTGTAAVVGGAVGVAGTAAAFGIAKLARDGKEAGPEVEASDPEKEE
jgi:hydrogenase small subunit